MRFPRLRLVSLLVLACFLAALVPEELYARRGGRISFGRSSSFSRSSRQSSRAASWGQKRSTQKPTLGGSRGRRPSTAASTTDRRVLDKARSQGTLYQTRAQATRAFQGKYGSQYTSKYATRPATRPGHIPATTTVNGQKVNVGYNPQYGGYGHMMGGRWYAYNAMADAAMFSLLMNRHGYAWGGGYGYRPYRSGFSFTSGLGVMLVIVIGGLSLRRRGY